MIDEIMEGMENAEEEARIARLIDEIVNSDEQKKERYRAANNKRSQNDRWRKGIKNAGAKRAKEKNWVKNNAIQREHLYKIFTTEKRIKAAKTSSKIIFCIEKKMFYKSISDASKKTKIHRRSINDAVLGKTKKCGGYHWRYATTEEVTEFCANQCATD